MSTRIVLFMLLGLCALAAGCKSVDCGDGTTERDGSCVAANQTVASARCGQFTVLQGDTCVPMFPPTICDPDSTAGDTDSSTGVTTCVGTGASSCAAKIACPASASGKQTICGQLYDFETGQAFAQSGATGTQCAAGATSGPCALGIRAFDAVMFAGSGGQSGALTIDAEYIDDCGRFRLTDVSQPTSAPIIALGIDDAAAAAAGAAGIATPSGVTLAATASTATKDVEAFVVKPSTAAGWSGPTIATTGVFGMVYHGHSTGLDNASGVTATRNGAAGDAAHTFYFGATATTRTTIDANNHMTGANGTALYTITSPASTDTYSGTGALPTGCMWDVHPALPVAGVVFVQIFRPVTNPASGTTCTL